MLSNLKLLGLKIRRLSLMYPKILLPWTNRNLDKSLSRFLHAKEVTGTIKKKASRFSKKACLPSLLKSRNLTFQQPVLLSGHIQNMRFKRRVKLKSSFLVDLTTSIHTTTLLIARATLLNSFTSQRLRNGLRMTGKVSKSLQTLKKTGKCTKSSVN